MPYTYKNTGIVTCISCNTEMEESKMMDIGEDNGSLVYCKECRGWKKWRNEDEA